ncbi:F-box domain-containing protein [Mycena sanguinolenta]|uniref:F-box domain-containing protein n=1 Tax=Mycena sanguinolenta TaxID=230812 RepID=A0A8H6XT29_9AGAR|nr:F-box domain-containing protein [Mycena sanguinolenta]
MFDPVQDPIAPIHRLPCEITSEIFVHCLPTSHSDRELNTANPREAPTLLLHICRIWREIATSTPALWGKMELSLHNAHCHDTAQAWLRRAKGRSISVKLHGWAFDYGDCEADGWAISTFQTLLERAHSLKFLELSAIPLKYMYGLAEPALHELDGSYTFPSLQQLTIGIKDGFTWSSFSMPDIRLFTHAPLLREVTFSDSTPPFFLSSLPWHQVTKYTGTRANLDDLLAALNLGSNLVECVLSMDRIDPDNTEILTHSNLKSLTIPGNGSSRSWSVDVLQFLTLPSLEALRIFDCPYNLFGHPDFLAFLARSSPPLRQFTARLNADTEVDVEQSDVDAFLSMPNVVEVEIWNANEIFLFVFSSHFDIVAFLPQLRHLSFFHPRHSSEDVVSKQLEEVQVGLIARWNSTARLKSFALVWDRDVGDISEDILVPFRTMASEGLDISIKSPTRSYI